MVFDPKAYETARKELREMKKSPEFVSYMKERETIKTKLKADARAVYTQLKARKYNDGDIASLASAIRAIAKPRNERK